MSIEHVEQDGRGAFRWMDGDASLGELSYLREPHKVIADHTVVDERLRGQGVAGRLLEQFLQWVEREGLLVEPRCSYVRRAFDTRPELAKLRA